MMKTTMIMLCLGLCLGNERRLVGDTSPKPSNSLEDTEETFLWSSGYLFDKEVEDSEIMEDFNRLVSSLGNFPFQKSLYENLLTLLTNSLGSLMKIRRIESQAQLEEEFMKLADEYLNPNSNIDISKRLKELFFETMKLIDAFVVTVSEDTEDKMVVDFTFLEKAEKRAYDLFSTKPNKQGALIKEFNSRQKALINASQKNIKEFKDFLNKYREYNGVYGANRILNDVRGVFDLLRSQDFEAEKFDESIYSRIAQANLAACEVEADPNTPDSLKKCILETVEIGQNLALSQRSLEHEDKVIADISIKIIQSILRFVHDQGNTDIADSIATNVVFKFANVFIPFSLENEHYALFIDELNPLAPYHGDISYVERTKLLMFISSEKDIPEEYNLNFIKHLDFICSVEHKDMMALSVVLYAFQSFPYSFGNDEAIDKDLLNKAYELIAEQIAKNRPEMTQVGPLLDKAINESDLSTDDKFFLKYVVGLLVLRHFEEVDYVSDFTGLEPSEGLITRMTKEWLYREEFVSLKLGNLKLISVKDWHALLPEYKLNLITEEIETEEHKAKKVELNKIDIVVEGKAKEMKMLMHDVVQVTISLDSKCQESRSEKQFSVPIVEKSLPTLYSYIQDGKQVPIATEEDFKAKKLECEKKFEVKTNIVHLVNGGLTPEVIKAIAESPEMMSYIKENGTVIEETEDEIHEITFVRRISESNPCYQSEDQ